MRSKGKNAQENAATAGAGASGSAREKPNETRPVCHKVADLDPGLQDLVQELLIAGATFEDVVESVEEQGGQRVTQRAVENFFRGNLEVQKQRVHHLVETAQEIKKSLGNPETAEGKLAEAAFFTGFMRLSRKTAELDLNLAHKARLERENLHLRQWVSRLRGQNLLTERMLTKARIRTELARGKLLQQQAVELQKTVQECKDPKELGPKLVEKIQEIYGIATLPSLPAAIR